jgi:hypothetical protein
MKRILLGTPLKGNPTKAYTLGLAEIMGTRFDGFEVIPSIVESTYVQTGRNELVYEARKHGCDELVFWDADIAAKAADLARLMSHDVDIVGAIYAKRVNGLPQWTCRAKTDWVNPPPQDLMHCNDVATGFKRIKMGVFDRLDEVFKHRRYRHGHDDIRTEYFTVGMADGDGCEHPSEVKLRILVEGILRGAISAHEAIDLINKDREVSIVGEDCMFCRMARHAGFDVWADTKLILRHMGEIGYPAQEIAI